MILSGIILALVFVGITLCERNTEHQEAVKSFDYEGFLCNIILPVLQNLAKSDDSFLEYPETVFDVLQITSETVPRDTVAFTFQKKARCNASNAEIACLITNRVCEKLAKVLAQDYRFLRQNLKIAVYDLPDTSIRKVWVRFSATLFSMLAT